MREKLFETPSQTAGPYVHIGTAPQSIGRPALSGQPGPVIESDTGAAITLEGVVHDGAGAPVRDAMLEIWQADGDGRVGPHGLFARAVADFGSGLYRFQTVKPGPHAKGHAPHIALLIFARGINIHLHTRVYFPEDADRIAADPDFARLSPEARDTLIAKRTEGETYRFDIHLQGPNETVFFDI
ncbi:protocatechuate 3,4-dioxygenase subunit alpha [Stappia stellulata]|uniref:protocatechuate 3,4-dioxygenase subunit alpha n=1 Tax=Stappia stellulata TaxID=71235 RepID=UPI0003FD6BEC|nr:protocatechuate 3,4-dioxygenase subunit alpha [Stappia stellulata]